MKYVIDRIVEGIAVCENDGGGFIEVSADLLPKGAKEGMSIIINANENIILADDSERAERIKGKMRSVWK
jgi:hypothetical protein